MVISDLSNEYIEQPVMVQGKSPNQDDVFDVIIIGCGPAGMSAAVCAARADLNVLIIEKAMPGGQCSTACKITNFIGQQSSILGDDLARTMERQVFLHDIYYTCETVISFQGLGDKTKLVQTSFGNLYRTTSIVLALGLEPKPLNAPFEAQFQGFGISYYAQSDPSLYEGKHVVVIGGGNCACYAADYLSGFAKSVYIIHAHDQLRAVKTLKKQIEETPNITLVWDSKVTEVFGIDHVEKVKTEHVLTGQSTWLDVSGVFIYIGRRPPQDIIQFELAVDDGGFIITDECMRTNIAGVYAVGDIRSKQVRQIAPAVSDGMIAAINVERDFFR